MNNDKKTLYILWTTDNLITAQHMVFLYAADCLRQQRFAQVHILVWGASVLLLSQNKMMLNEARKFQALGGLVSICRRCAEKHSLLAQLESMRELSPARIDYLADFLTGLLQSGQTLLTV
jgi:hypothetical protein